MTKNKKMPKQGKNCKKRAEKASAKTRRTQWFCSVLNHPIGPFSSKILNIATVKTRPVLKKAWQGGFQRKDVRMTP